MKKLETLKFKHFCMTIGNLPSSYVESLSYYECLMWLCKYLQDTVIPAVNNNAEAVEELQGLYLELKSYVDNYFDNLDVQEEIDNKLNEMVESGELASILLNYTNICKIFDTVSDMISDETLVSGTRCKTLGYYNINDGGSAEYIIVETEHGYCEELSNNLYAELLIYDNQVNIKQLGAKSTDSSLVKNDISTYINTYITLLDTYNNLKLYIPAGGYYCSQVNIARSNGFCIIGDEGFTTDYVSGTVISSYNNDQDYIFNIGSNQLITYNWKIKNIYFTSCNYSYDEQLKPNNNDIKELKYALNLLYCVTGITDNLFFGFIHGGAMQICSSWENYFKLLNFRYIYNVNSNILNFKTVDSTITIAANITANLFERIFVESVFAKRVINFDYNCGAVNNNFGLINFEESWFNLNNLPIVKNLIDISTWNDNADDVVHMALIGGYRTSAIIDSINIDVIGYSYLAYNNLKYVYDTIFTHDINYGGMNITTSNIEVDNCTIPIKIYRVKDYTTELYTRNLVDNIINKGNNNLIYDVNGFTYIKCNSPLITFRNSVDDAVIKLQNDITPAYKVINLYDRGVLYSNQNALNDLKLCVKPFNNNFSHNSMTILKKGTNLTINALIPDGETVTLLLTCGSGLNQNVELVGTGSFKEYNIEFNETILGTPNKNLGIRLSTITTSTNILIDYLY